MKITLLTLMLLSISMETTRTSPAPMEEEEEVPSSLIRRHHESNGASDNWNPPSFHKTTSVNIKETPMDEEVVKVLKKIFETEAEGSSVNADESPISILRRTFGNGEGSRFPDIFQNGGGGHPRILFEKFSNIMNRILGGGGVSCPKNTTEAEVLQQSTAADKQDESTEVLQESTAANRQEQSESLTMNISNAMELLSIEIIQRIAQNIKNKLQAVGIPTLKEFILMVYGQACSEKNCEQNADTCMRAIEPPSNMVEYRVQCLREFFKAMGESRNGIAAMVNCFKEGIFTSMGLTYTDDDKENALTYLQERVVNNTDLNGAGQIVYDMVANNTCIPSEVNNFEVKEEITFYLCLVQKCVSGMAENTE